MKRFDYRIQRADGTVLARGKAADAEASWQALERLQRKHGGWLESVIAGGPDDDAPLESAGTFYPRVFTARIAYLGWTMGRRRRCHTEPGQQFNVFQRRGEEVFGELDHSGGRLDSVERVSFPRAEFLAATRRLTRAELRAEGL